MTFRKVQRGDRTTSVRRCLTFDSQSHSDCFGLSLLPYTNDLRYFPIKQTKLLWFLVSNDGKVWFSEQTLACANRWAGFSSPKSHIDGAGRVCRATFLNSFLCQIDSAARFDTLAETQTFSIQHSGRFSVQNDVKDSPLNFSVSHSTLYHSDNQLRHNVHDYWNVLQYLQWWTKYWDHLLK